MKDLLEESMPVGIFTFRKEEWPLWKQHAFDRDIFEDTWDDWHVQMMRTRAKLESQNLRTTLIEVGFLTFREYCKMNNLRNDSAARSGFVAKVILGQIMTGQDVVEIND